MDAASADALAKQIWAGTTFKPVIQGAVNHRIKTSLDRYFAEHEVIAICLALRRIYRRGAERRRNQWRAQKYAALTDSLSEWDGDYSSTVRRGKKKHRRTR